ncbi:MAG: RNA polymerase sigma factor [Acidimicrobiales bacterium]
MLVTGSHAAAEDAVHEALARAWERRDHVDQLDRWVVTTALNLARSRWRKLRREVHDSDHERSIPPVDPVSVDVDRALRGLPRRQREVVVLHYLLDMPVAEIAEHLGLSEGGVKPCRGFGVVGQEHGPVRAQNLQQRGLTFRPPARGAQHRPVDQPAVGVHPSGSPAERLGQRLCDHPGPLLGPGHVPHALTGRQQRAVAHPQHGRVAHLARRQCRHGLVETGEPLRDAALDHHRVAAVGQRAHLQLGVVELVRQLQGPRCCQLQPVDVVGLARDHRQLDVAQLDASSLGSEQPPCPGHPAPPDDPVPESRRVQVGERGCDQRCGPRFARLLPLPERQLQLPERADQIVVEEQQATQQLPGRRVRTGRDSLSQVFERARHVTLTQRNLSRPSDTAPSTTQSVNRRHPSSAPCAARRSSQQHVL